MVRVQDSRGPDAERAVAEREGAASGPLGNGGRPFRGVVRNPAYVQVADQIRQAIFDGTFAPGDELPSERELSVEFGVSRATVREARRALEAQGLLATGRSAPFKATVSALPDALAEVFESFLRFGRVSLFDVIQFRGILELEAVDRATLDTPTSDWQEMRAALERMQGVGEWTDQLDEAYLGFHLGLARSSGNEALYLTLHATQSILADHLRACFRDLAQERDADEQFARFCRDHAELLRALEAGDAPRARTLLLKQINDFSTQVLMTQAPVSPPRVTVVRDR